MSSIKQLEKKISLLREEENFHLEAFRYMHLLEENIVALLENYEFLLNYAKASGRKLNSKFCAKRLEKMISCFERKNKYSLHTDVFDRVLLLKEDYCLLGDEYRIFLRYLIDSMYETKCLLDMFKCFTVESRNVSAEYRELLRRYPDSLQNVDVS